MLSIEDTKKLMGKGQITDEEARELRDACYQLAAFLYDEWLAEDPKTDPKPADLQERR